MKSILRISQAIELDGNDKNNTAFQEIQLSNEYVGKEVEANERTSNFDIIGKYREQVISTFSSPF